MNARVWILLMIGWLGAAAPSLPAAPTPEEIAQWARQLGADDFATREKASKLLWAAGKAAEPALRLALKSDDAEVRRRASEILDKFRWGIYPDTPDPILRLIERYRASDDPRPIIKELLDRGSEGYSVLLRIRTAEDNEGRKQNLQQALSDEVPRIAGVLLVEGKTGLVEELLEQTLKPDNERGFQNYVAYWLLQGKLEEKSATWRKRLEQGNDAVAAELLCWLCRARGDQAGARQAAEKSGKEHLLRGLLWEQGDWKTLLARFKPPTEIDGKPSVEGLGFVAAYQRLSGQAAEFEKTIAALRKAVDPKETDAGEVWFAGEALLLNDRPQDAIDLFVQHQHYRRAFELLAAQLRFREAFALADRAAEARSSELILVEVARARALHRLGEKDRARAVFTRIAERIKDAPNPTYFASLLEAERELGLTEEAFRHCAQLLGWTPRGDKPVEGLGDEWDLGLIGNVIPDKYEAVKLWWRYLRRRHPDEPVGDTLQRLRDLLGPKPTARDLAALVQDAEENAREVKPDDRRLVLLAETCLAAGREDLARTYLDKAVAVATSPAPLIRLADLLVEKKQWKEAAEQYHRAWEKERTSAVPFWLRGWCLVQAGQEAEGRKLMELAHWLPLGNDEARYHLEVELEKRNQPDALRRERQLMAKIGGFDSWYAHHARQHLADELAHEGDYGVSADWNEAYMLDSLHNNTALVETEAYLILPEAVHYNRARALLKQGKGPAALREIQLAEAILPGDVELPIRLLPGLVKNGLKKEADDLYQRVFRRYEALSKDYPRSAFVHNSIAWLAVCCRRDLDLAMKHATRAVELAPDVAAYQDTLAEVHFQHGQTARAIELMKKCVAKEPKFEFFRQQLKRYEAGDPTAPVPEER